jgi:hypothetical protein
LTEMITNGLLVVVSVLFFAVANYKNNGPTAFPIYLGEFFPFVGAIAGSAFADLLNSFKRNILEENGVIYSVYTLIRSLTTHLFAGLVALSYSGSVLFSDIGYPSRGDFAIAFAVGIAINFVLHWFTDLASSNVVKLEK